MAGRRMQMLQFLTLGLLAFLTSARHVSSPPSFASNMSISLPMKTFSTRGFYHIHDWPATPWAVDLNDDTSIVISSYGRHLCLPRTTHCETPLLLATADIARSLSHEYEPAPSHTYCYSSEPAYFCFKQDDAVGANVVLNVLHAMEMLTSHGGAVEVTEGGILKDEEIIGRWMFTYPGM